MNLAELIRGTLPELEKLISTLQAISTSIMVIAWIAVAIGWFAGWFKIAIPIPSRQLKRVGREEVETAGMAAFFIAIFSTLITIIIWIIRAVGGVVTVPTL